MGPVEVAVYSRQSSVDRDVVVSTAGRRVSLADFMTVFCKRIKDFVVPVFKFYLFS